MMSSVIGQYDNFKDILDFGANINLLSYIVYK